jgi:hypothetical protein
VIPLAKVQINGAEDEVDAEASLEKALDILKLDTNTEKEFDEPILKTADEELLDIIRIIRKQIIKDIKNIIQ